MKPAISGRSKTNPKKARSFEHLHSWTATHDADRTKVAERRTLKAEERAAEEVAEEFGVPKIEEAPGGHLDQLKILLGRKPKRKVAVNPLATIREDGFVVDLKNKRDLSPQEHVDRMTQLYGERKVYWAYDKRTRREQREETEVPLGSMTITSRPDHDRAMKAITEEGHDVIPLYRRFITEWLPQEFTAASDYDLQLLAMHLGEGNIHMHPIYASVDENGFLLHHKQEGRGRRGPGLLGPATIGVARLVENGFIPKERGQKAEAWALRKIAENGGREPPDLVLSRAWDSYMYMLSLKPEFAPHFARERANYAAEINERLAGEESGQIAALTAQLRASEREKAELRGWHELMEEINGELSSLHAPPSFEELPPEIDGVLAGHEAQPANLPDEPKEDDEWGPTMSADEASEQREPEKEKPPLPLPGLKPSPTSQLSDILRRWTPEEIAANIRWAEKMRAEAKADKAREMGYNE
jgi:hypothetical protein